MYFITAGEVEIDLPSQRVRLSDGTFFGEIALLHRTKRSGTVTATRKTRLLALDAQDFHALIERLPALAAHVKETAEARLADTARRRKATSPPLVEMGELAERDWAFSVPMNRNEFYLFGVFFMDWNHFAGKRSSGADYFLSRNGAITSRVSLLGTTGTISKRHAEIALFSAPTAAAGGDRRIPSTGSSGRNWVRSSSRHRSVLQGI